MTTWSDPATWSAGVVVTNTAMNTQIRDQLNFLKAMPMGLAQTGGTFSTTSTAFAVINTAAFQQVITSYGGDLQINANFPLFVNNSTAMFDVYLDGTGIGDDYTGFGMINGPSTNVTYKQHCMTPKLTGVASGVHTVGLHWRTTNGTVTIPDQGWKQFEVREVTTSAS